MRPTKESPFFQISLFWVCKGSWEGIRLGLGVTCPPGGQHFATQRLTHHPRTFYQLTPICSLLFLLPNLPLILFCSGGQETCKAPPAPFKIMPPQPSHQVIRRFLALCHSNSVIIIAVGQAYFWGQWLSTMWLQPTNQRLQPAA